MARARVIAAAQTVPVRDDVDANLAQHVRLARIAAEEEAQVLVFPELSLTGYELDLAAGLAFSPSDPRLGPLVEAASADAMTLIVGAPVRIGGRLHIGAFVLAPDGRIEIYTKRHLGAFPASASCDGVVPAAEATVFQPGDLDPLVRIGEGSAAVAVCADALRPSHPRQAAMRGATIYLASMFVIRSSLESETETVRANAAAHSLAVALANYGGPSGGLAAGGRSAIWSEHGERLVQLDAAGAGVAVALETAAGWRARATMLGEPPAGIASNHGSRAKGCD